MAPETHWPELEVLILVVSDHKKPVSSTEGMRRTVMTSELLKVRLGLISPHRLMHRWNPTVCAVAARKYCKSYEVDYCTAKCTVLPIL